MLRHHPSLLPQGQTIDNNVDHLSNTTVSTIIKKLKCHFARQGIPDIVISDNGPQFACEKFSNFASEWDFEHRPGSPGHQQTNGKAEAAVKEAKCFSLFAVIPKEGDVT